MNDYIDRRAVIDFLQKWIAYDDDGCQTLEVNPDTIFHGIEAIPSAEIEPLTDNEQGIFLAAMRREEKVCKQVDEEYGGGEGAYEDNLVRICHEITRKVKGALWTI